MSAHFPFIDSKTSANLFTIFPHSFRKTFMSSINLMLYADIYRADVIFVLTQTSGPSAIGEARQRRRQTVRTCPLSQEQNR